jgi:hypothetical protein
LAIISLRSGGEKSAEHSAQTKKPWDEEVPRYSSPTMNQMKISSSVYFFMAASTIGETLIFSHTNCE